MSALERTWPPSSAATVEPEAVRRALRRWHEPDLGRTELAGTLAQVAAHLAREGRADTVLERAEALRAALRRGLEALREAGYAEAADLLVRQYVRQDALMVIADDMALGERGYFKRQRAAVEALAQAIAGLEAQVVPPPGPTRPSPSAPFQAPPAPRWWVGREGEVAALTRALRPGSESAAGPRVAGIIGMGGLGKTSLAARLAHGLADAFPDGVLWLDMAAADADSALLQLAGAWGEFERVAGLADRAARAATVRELLNRRRALVVLDDVQRDDQIAPLLPSAGESAVLVTSRRADLAALQGAPICALAPLSPADCAALLRLAIGEERVAAEPEAAAELLNRCEHLPLAVDVAARLLGRRPAWRLADLSARLDAARLEALVWDEARVVEASIAQSWDQLEAPRKAFFAALGAFADQIDPAAAVVAAGTSTDAWDAGEWLEQLADRSLVLRASATRYRLHPLVRDFVTRRFDADASAAALAGYYTARLEAEDARLVGPERREALAWFDAELPNLEALRLWAAARPEAEGGLELVAACGGWAYQYFVRRTRYETWRRWSEEGLAAAETLADPRRVGACCRQLAFLEFRVGDLDRSEVLFDRARAAFEAAGDARAVMSVRHAALGIRVRRGQWAEALAEGSACLPEAEQLGDLVLVARLSYLVGLAHARTGATEVAVGWYTRAAEAADAAGDAVDAGFAHGALAEMCRRLGRLEDGVRHARLAVDIAESVEDVRRLTRGQDALGELHLAASDLDEAAEVYARMTALAEPYAEVDPSDLVAAQIGHGRVATLRADWAAAGAALDRALALSRRTANAYLEGESLRYLAEMHLARGAGHAGEAARCAVEAHLIHTARGRAYAASRARQTLAAALGGEEEAAAWLAAQAARDESAE